MLSQVGESLRLPKIMAPEEKPREPFLWT